MVEFIGGMGFGMFLTGLLWIGLANNDTCAHKLGVRTPEYALCKYQQLYGQKP